MAHGEWQVRLGESEWARFTYARPDGDPLRLLGSVRCGARIGALAVTPESTYVQVNGDYLTPLNNSQIRCALAKAQTSKEPAKRLAARAPAPVVVVKRRRMITGQDTPEPGRPMTT
jgi:hypothetical protein